jgi:transcription elongation factor GreA
MTKPMLTADEVDNLREELERLRQMERPRLIEAIADARESPALQQGAEYSRVIESQQRVERRIAELESKLAKVQVTDDVGAKHSDGPVSLGASVTLRTEPEGKPVCYRIVGESEADIPSGKLSVSAPLARALLGHEKDELVAVDTPGGTQTYQIVEIRYGE